MKTDHMRVLLLEDDLDYAKIIRLWLSRDPYNEYDIASFSIANKALNHILTEATPFDCLLVDYRLPDMSGIEFIQNLSEQIRGTLPPAILMTADGGEEAAIAAVKTQVADFLPKLQTTKEGVCRAVRNAGEKGRLTREIDIRQEKLRAAYSQLERKTLEIQRFYHTVSHEIKTPLTAAREFVSIVKDGLAGETNDQQEELLGHALVCCDRITTQFNDLIDMTRLETGKLTLELKPSCLNTLLDHALSIAYQTASKKGIILEHSINPNLPQVTMDANRITQVITNLVGNALKFTESGGRVRVSVRRLDNTRLRLRVLDTGCGVSDQHISQIFDRLYQVEDDMDRSNDSGLGLGLSISREIVQGHGQQLRVRSRSSLGSCFSFDLDIAEVNTDSNAAPEAEQSEALQRVAR